jgi:hypothetical protein
MVYLNKIFVHGNINYNFNNNGNSSLLYKKYSPRKSISIDEENCLSFPVWQNKVLAIS